jgi:hypothetical protein
MSELEFGRLVVNRTGRYNGLGVRRSDPEEQRLYRAPVEARLAVRSDPVRDHVRADDEEEDETEGDLELDEFLRRHRRDF